jgi:hypothetical protein
MEMNMNKFLATVLVGVFAATLGTGAFAGGMKHKHSHKHHSHKAAVAAPDAAK